MPEQQPKVSIPQILPQITKPWSQKLLANLNDEYDFKIAKLRGDFVFHSHPDTDELFYILSGTLFMRMKEPENENSEGCEDVTVSFHCLVELSGFSKSCIDSIIVA
jgi:mannose-6-phosphate isomerase-like protein (cupin superfamily)